MNRFQYFFFYAKAQALDLSFTVFPISQLLAFLQNIIHSKIVFGADQDSESLMNKLLNHLCNDRRFTRPRRSLNQKKIFNILGFTNEDITRKFGYFVKAFEYGTPPHGGIAFGLERLSMIICGTDNIRDVIAFPKTASASDLMSECPNIVDGKQLKELGININK